MKVQEHRFFKFFPQEQADFIIQNSSILEYTQPTCLFDEGEEGGIMFLILDGEVEISGKTYAGNYQHISTLKVNDFFGEFSSIDGKSRNARAWIPRYAKLVAIPRHILLKALENSPISTIQSFFAHVIERVRRFHNRFFHEIVRNQRMLVIGELTNSIMHDLKSPMGIITGTAALIRQRHQEDKETTQLCDLIDIQVKRVLEMISEVLDFVKGSTTIVRKETHLGSLFEYFSLLNHQYFRHIGIDLSIPRPNVILPIDPDKIIRVLQNLINNAAQAMSQGGWIKITTEEKEHYVDIFVCDNGPGIPEDIRSRLFEPFIESSKIGGTGLGISIANSLVQSHGGILAFQTSSSGTTFLIRLPKRIDYVVDPADLPSGFIYHQSHSS